MDNKNSNLPVNTPSDDKEEEPKEMKQDMSETALGETAKSKMLDIGYNSAYIAYQTRFLGDLYKGQALPKNLDTIGKALMAVQAGYELNVSPIQSLNSFAFINGKLTMYGPLGISLVQRAGHKVEWGACNREEATCAITRADNNTKHSVTIKLSDLQRAGFKNLSFDSWKLWPDTMLKYRAFWSCAKFVTADALNGISSAEEQTDIIEGQVVSIKNTDKPATKHSSLESELEKPTEVVAIKNVEPMEEKPEPKKVKKDIEKVDIIPDPQPAPEPVKVVTDKQKYNRLVTEEIEGVKLTPAERMFMGKYEHETNFKK